MYQITKRLKSFSAAHRLIKGYTGPCQHLHGHNYALEVTCAATQLDHFDFVIDFDILKKLFDGWVQTHWDHATLVSEQDLALRTFLDNESQRHFVLPGDRNTTAERLAEHLWTTFNQLLKNANQDHVHIISVRVFESDTASACFTKP